MVSDPSVLDEIEECFKQNEPLHQELEHVSVNHQDCTVTCYTLNSPRLPKGQTEEFEPGVEVSLRVKTNIAEGDAKSIARVLLVLVGLAPEEEIDWDAIPFSQYEF